MEWMTRRHDNVSAAEVEREGLRCGLREKAEY